MQASPARVVCEELVRVCHVFGDKVKDFLKRPHTVFVENRVPLLVVIVDIPIYGVPIFLLKKSKLVKFHRHRLPTPKAGLARVH